MLITQFEIRRQVHTLSELITHQFKKLNAEKDPIYCICVMDGAFMFFSDLMRELSLNVKTKFLTAKSYKGTKAEELYIFNVETDFLELQEQHVLIVEDIVDTGGTALGIIEKIQAFKPKRLEFCTLLEKTDIKKLPVDTTYTGFMVEKDIDFLIGYGLDLDGKFRQLPFITTLDEIKESPRSYLNKYI